MNKGRRIVFEDDHVVYGMRAGQLLHVAEVPRGRDCGCVCASCGKPLIARKGSIRRHHFAHLDVTGCRGAPESILHLLSKQLLSELEALLVPPYEFRRKRKMRTGAVIQHQALVAKGGLVRIDRVRVEKREGDFIPDIVIESGSRMLIVEIAVSNKVKRPKLRRMRMRNLPAIEIRLEPRDAFQSRDWLKEKLRNQVASKMWLFHPSQREAERSYLSKWRAAISSDRSMLKKPYEGANDRTARESRYKPDLQSGPPLSEYDRTAEAFNRKHGRYPFAEECLKLWPRLYKKRFG